MGVPAGPPGSISPTPGGCWLTPLEYEQDPLGVRARPPWGASRSPGECELAPWGRNLVGDTPRTLNPPYIHIASSRFTLTGCAVPSSWAKTLTRNSSSIQRNVSCCDFATCASQWS